MMYRDFLSPENYQLEVSCYKALIALSGLALLMATGLSLKFKSFLPNVHLIVAAFSFLAYYVLTEVIYTIIFDEGVYLLIYYISVLLDYVGRISVWLAAVEVFRLNPRVKLIWILVYLMYLLALGLYGVEGICVVVFGIVQMVLGNTTSPVILEAMAKSKLVALYMPWAYVGSVFLFFVFYHKTVNHFYGTFILYYLFLVPGLLVLTVNENALSKTDQGDIRKAFIAEFVVYRLAYLFAIGWGSLFASQWAKSKEVRQPGDVTADAVDIDIDDFDEKAEATNSSRVQMV
ncbi:unnamed protein product [Cunninghamella blakesleeana]